jgi:hypothetical protein
MRKVVWCPDRTTKLLLALIGIGLWMVALRPAITAIPASAQEPEQQAAALRPEVQALLKALRDPAHPIPISLGGEALRVALEEAPKLEVQLAEPVGVTLTASSSSPIPVSVQQASYGQLRVQVETEGGASLPVRVTDFEPDPLPVRAR